MLGDLSNHIYCPRSVRYTITGFGGHVYLALAPGYFVTQGVPIRMSQTKPLYFEKIPKVDTSRFFFFCFFVFLHIKIQVLQFCLICKSFMSDYWSFCNNKKCKSRLKRRTQTEKTAFLGTISVY